MAYTRANLEAVLVDRAGPLMVKASMDGTTVDGTNSDLNDPIGYAVRRTGGSVTDITSVADADLTGIDDVDEVLLLAEIRLLNNILGNLDDVDVTLGPRSEKLSQLASQVQRKLDRLEEEAKTRYGYGAAVMSAGSVTVLFAEHGT